MYCLIIYGINYKSNLKKRCIQQQQIIRLNNKTPNRIHNLYKLHKIYYIKHLKLKIYI